MVHLGTSMEDSIFTVVKILCVCVWALASHVSYNDTRSEGHNAPAAEGWQRSSRGIFVFSTAISPWTCSTNPISVASALQILPGLPCYFTTGLFSPKEMPRGFDVVVDDVDDMVTFFGVRWNF